MMEKFGKYTIINEIGRGGMGEVYKAHDPMIDRTVAIKIVSGQLEELAELKQRLYREARSAGRLSHENITIIHDVAEHEGRPYIVMEFLEGVDLKTLIEKRVDLDLAVKLGYAIQILKGLDYAHRHEVVHRDVKPENIKILPNGRIKIMDFGIAKPDRTSLTEQGVMLGTPSYIAPEQVRGEEVDARSDIFSFGILFQEMLTYRKPFTGNLTTTIYKIVHEDPEALDTERIPFGAELQRIIDRCLQKRREDRYASCREIIPDLTNILHECEGDTDRTILLTTSQFEVDPSSSAHSSGGTTIQNLLKRGKSFFDQGEYARAEAIFKIILDRSPRHQIALDFLDRIRQDLHGIESSLKTSVPGEPSKSGRTRIFLGFAALTIAILVFVVWRFRGPGQETPLETLQDQPQISIDSPPEDQALDMGPDIDAAEKAMIEARDMAKDSGAERLAAELFNRGVLGETEARRLSQNGEAQAAIDQYREAERLYYQSQSLAETQAAKDDLAQLRTLADREGERARAARLKAESVNAATRAAPLFQEAEKLERQAIAARDRGDSEGFIAARNAYGEAYLKFKDAENRAREVDKERARAIQARSSLASARDKIPAPDQNATRPQYARAISIEEKGKTAFARGDYQAARTAFNQARLLFEEVRENIGIEQKEAARALKRRVATARTAADPDNPGYTDAALAEQQGDDALGQGSFREALARYDSALNGFRRAERKTPPPGSTGPDRDNEPSSTESLEDGIKRLTDQYSRAMIARDAGLLASLLSYSDMEKKGWDAFFESAEQIQVRAEHGIVNRGSAKGTVTIKVFLNYYNKRNSSRENRDFAMTWRLKREAGTWQIISRK